jgi:hypothetical protein
LHSGKHEISRVYTYLPQVVPAHVCLSSVTLDLTSNKLRIEGDSDSQKTVNTFIDTLKFTKYSVDGADSGKYAFPSVVESQFSISSSSGDQTSKCDGITANAKFGADVDFDAVLFSNAEQVSLNVPTGLVTTRSVLSDPSSLFNGTIPVNQPSATGAQ